jgi:Mg-chelatase subunit ChlD
MNPDIFSLNSPIIFFPIRHHSPACARLVRELAFELQPTAILIEGPSDFNPRINELTLPHQLPIAIYSFVHFSDEKRRSAFYPFCIYSPEWQAIQVAQELGIDAKFIDLPWAEMALAEIPSHRYADTELRQSNYVTYLCHKLGVEDFDTLWDTLFEIDRFLTPSQYLERCHHFCFHIRTTDLNVSMIDYKREAFMVDKIRAAIDEYQQKILVVTGGFHSYALYAKVFNIPFEETDENFQSLNPNPQSSRERGIALTPYSYHRLDNLTGYEAGMPNPGFYHHIWQDRTENNTTHSYRKLLAQIANTLRQKGQVVSAADLIAVETTARGLAALRGHDEVWRQDLIDGIIGSLVKEELEYGYTHPFLAAVYEVFRGNERGLLAVGTKLPPLVYDLQQLLHQYHLEPESKERTIELDLYNTEDKNCSNILHQLRILGIVGYQRTGGSNLATREDLSHIYEQWTIQWSPEFEAGCIEAAIYGTRLADAAIAKLSERTTNIERDAEKAALILLDASLMGLSQAAEIPYQRLVGLIRSDSDFINVTRALRHLLYLYRYDEVLGTKGQHDIGKLLGETFNRSLWLLECLGKILDKDKELLQAIKVLLETFERCYSLPLISSLISKEEFVNILQRVSDDTIQTPLLRGTVTGVMWILGEANSNSIIWGLRYFSEPSKLGDFLTGFFYIAREIIQRHPELMLSINQPVMEYNEDEFLQALPSLRLAFSFFTPREKYHIARTLLQALGLADTEPLPKLELTPEIAAKVLRFEAKLFQTSERYGLRLSHNRQIHSSEKQLDSHQKYSSYQSKISNLTSPSNSRIIKIRWRLILGSGTDSILGAIPEGICQEWECAIAFLYDREYAPSRNVRRVDNRQGTLDESQLTVPNWINKIHELFPQKTIERLEKDALERYQLEEMVTNPDLLSRAKPNQTLLKAVLRTKHLMNQDVLAIARKLVRQVIEQLLEKLSRSIQSPFLGAINRQQRSFLKVAKNFDAETTIRRNLSNYDPKTKRLYIKTPYFYSRIHRHVDRWQIIILVDESGSMLDSVIHAAVTAAIFFGIKSIRTHLCLFDTSVVDVTNDCNDPVETIMKVQLGGGTDISHALTYAASLVDNPRRTIVVLITDFFEGAPVHRLFSVTKQLIESGVTLLGLAALDEQAKPTYDRNIAAKLVALGAHVAAMTPGELAEWVAQKVR